MGFGASPKMSMVPHHRIETVSVVWFHVECTRVLSKWTESPARRISRLPSISTVTSPARTKNISSPRWLIGSPLWPGASWTMTE